MKAAKILSFFAVAIVTLAAAAWLLRVPIARHLSTPLLREYQLSLDELSIDALSHQQARVGHLELRQDDGTKIVIEELRLPLQMITSRTGRLVAEKVMVAPPASDTSIEAAAIADMAELYFSLPHLLPGVEIAVAELTVGSLPTLTSVRWSGNNGGQSLRLRLGASEIFADTAPAGAAHEVSVRLQPVADAQTATLAFTGQIEISEDELALTGSAGLDPNALMSLLDTLELAPAAQNVAVDTGQGMLELQARIARNEGVPSMLQAVFLPSAPLQFTYEDRSGSGWQLLAGIPQRMDASLTFPGAVFSFETQQADLRLDLPGVDSIPIAVTAITCRSGLTCSMTVKSTLQDLTLPVGHAARLEAHAAAAVDVSPDGIEINLEPEARIVFNDAVMNGMPVETLDVQLVSGATVQVSKADWRFTADSVDANVKTLGLAENMTLSAPVYLENVTVQTKGEALQATTGLFIPSSLAVWDGRSVALPGVRGEVVKKPGEVTADLATVGLQSEGTIEARYGLVDGAATLSLRDAVVSFASTPLSARVSPWRVNGDIRAGTIGIGLQLSSNAAAAGREVDAEAHLDINGLVGHFGGTALAGLSSRVEVGYDSSSGFVVEPSTLKVDLVDPGLPLEDLTADYALDVGAGSVDVRNLRMRAFDGVVTADPFSFDTGSERNTVTMRAEGLALNKLLTVEEFDDVEVTGRVDAELPVTIANGAITVQGGSLSGRPPGGVIRYLAGAAAGNGNGSLLGIAQDALSNFQYDTLTSAVEYDEDGDLELKTRLTGRNPDMQGSRPIVLNLNIENNVPKMIRSIQGARNVEAIIERRLQE